MFVPRVVYALLVLAAFTTLTHAQAAGTGFPLFNSFAQHGTDTINEGNLNVHIEIPIFTKAGRGLPVNYVISYDALNWYAVLSPTNNVYYWTWPGTGWHLQPISGYVTWVEIDQTHACNGLGLKQRTNYVYHDPSGGSHLFSNATATEADCYGVPHGFALVSAGDGSGFSLVVDDSLAASITTKEGKLIHDVQQGGSNENTPLVGLITDTNGNQINNLAQADTLGVPALQQSCTPNGSQCTVAYPSPTNPSTFVGATFNYTQVSIQANFGCGGVVDVGAGFQNLLTSITLADNSHYLFTYEQTPGYPAGNTTGRIASVTLPSGAQITYQYTGANNGIICDDGSVAGLNRITPDGQWTYTRTVTQQPPPSIVASSVTTLIDPMGNKQVINFGKGDSIEKMRQIYTGSSTLVKTIETCLNGAAFPCTSTSDPSVPGIATEKTVREEFPNSSGKVSEVDTFYTRANGPELPTDVWEYDFGSAAPGALIRHTKTTYAGPLTANIFYDPNNPSVSYSTALSDLPASVTVYDGSANTLSQTTYAYDETTPTSTTGTPSHVPVTGSHGNLTTITRLVQGTTTIHISKSYYDTGMLNTETDANGNPPTTYTYGTGSCGNAFPTEVTNAAGFNTFFTWDCNGGVMTSTTDPNNQTTSYKWGDPNYWRLTQITYPDGGQKTETYNSATIPWTITQSTKITGTVNLTTKTIYDTLARVSQQQLTSDPDGTTYTDTIYDGDGRVKSVSNPYRSTSDSTYGVTTHLYDGLGRVTSITKPDGSVVGTSYSANQTTITDEIGNQRKTQMDGLGRLTVVWEAPNASGYNFESDYQYDALGNLICAVQKGTDTTAFTNCASAPASWRPRSFTYDSLSRLLTASNPESGTTTYTYDNNGNVLTQLAPKPGQTGTQQTTTTYSYDSLNRLTQESYTNPSNTADKYAYDGGTLTACGLNPPALSGATNLVGRRSAMCGAKSGSSFSYDPMGRVLVEDRSNHGTSTKTYKTTYSYNADGSLATLTYPSGDVLTYTPGGAGRPLGVSDSSNDYVANGTGASRATYAPQGALATMVKGYTSTFAGIPTFNTYNDRLQPILISAGTPTLSTSITTASYTSCSSACTAIYNVSSSTGINVNDTVTVSGNSNSLLNGNFTVSGVGTGTVTVNFGATSGGTGNGGTLSDADSGNLLSLCYDFHAKVAISSDPCSFSASTTGDNGNVLQVLNNVDPTRSSAYIYDPLNRIAQAYTLNGSSSNCWGETYANIATAPGVLPAVANFGIDAWGNLTQRSGVSGMGNCKTEGLSATANTKNQISIMSYDAAGNVLNDGNGNQPTYDDMNRISTDAGYTYSYDADAVRMEKTNGSTGTMYWTGSGGETLTESDLTGAVNEEYVYFNGERIARIDRPSGTVHYYFTNHLGSHTLITSASGACEQDIDYYPYGGVIVDHCPSVSQHYKFTGKERDSESGLDYFGARHHTSALGRFMTPDPKMPSLKHLANPQKWNKYAYVLNNPLALVDPDGREEVTVTIRAYIPQQSFRFPPVIGPTWKGDGPAGHGRNATSYRVQATVKIETDQSVRKSSNPVVSVTGDTTGSSVNWYGLGTQTGRSNVSATASGTYDQNGNAVVQIKVSGSDPLAPGAPPAAGTFSVTVPQGADQITTTGTITPYPNWEGYASSESGGQATLFQTSGSPDDSPANLFLGQTQGVASWAELVNDQPQTCDEKSTACTEKTEGPY